MDKLPTDLQLPFFKLFNEEITIEDFEQWVYSEPELEKHLPESDYFDLISLSFKSRHAIHDILKIAKRFLDFGEYGKRKLTTMLNDLLSKNDRFAKSLIRTYDLYCDGYGFLDNLGLGYGLTFSSDFYDFNDWEKLSREQKDARINEIYDDLKREVLKVQSWLTDKKIVITGELNEHGDYHFEDFRTESEKEPTGYSVINLDESKSDEESDNESL